MAKANSAAATEQVDDLRVEVSEGMSRVRAQVAVDEVAPLRAEMLVALALYDTEIAEVRAAVRAPVSSAASGIPPPDPQIAANAKLVS